MQDIAERGLLLVGCGFMGGALLEGWLAEGLPGEAVTVQDPAPSDWLSAQPVRINTPPPDHPAIIVVATKPQKLGDVLPGLAGFGGGQSIVVSIAAGAPLALFESHFGPETPVVRAMPNLPASVGAGVTALVGNAAAGDAALAEVSALFEAVGTVVRLEAEEQMHLVTGLSGSGPAYVFALAEEMAQAGVALGLPEPLAQALARQTVVGAGRMLAAEGADPVALRKAVTSPGGTTAAGLAELQSESGGLRDLARRTVAAAARRSEELSKG